MYIQIQKTLLTSNVSSPYGWGWVAHPDGNLETLRVSADPWALKCPKILVKHPRMLKSATFACTPVTLRHPNLSHMDFLDSPAAIHSSRTPISDATQSVSPNELMHPEKSKKNHHLFIYSFLGSGPAISPASAISSHACIVLLSGASSSSHVS